MSIGIASRHRTISMGGARREASPCCTDVGNLADNSSPPTGPHMVITLTFKLQGNEGSLVTGERAEVKNASAAYRPESRVQTLGLGPHQSAEGRPSIGRPNELGS